MAEFMEQLKLVLVLLMVLALSIQIYKIVYRRLCSFAGDWQSAQQPPVHRRRRRADGEDAPWRLEGIDDDE